MVTLKSQLAQKDNRILQFIYRMHEFELQNNLFDIQDKSGLRYWDIVRAPVVIALFNATTPNTTDRLRNTLYLYKKSPFSLKKLLTGFAFIRWWFVNELNFYYHTSKKKRFIFQAVSRFLKDNGTKPIDAVADELIAILPPNDTLVMESFANDNFGPIRYRSSPYFSYKIWYIKKLRRVLNRHDYEADSQIADLLSTEFGTEVNWRQLIQDALDDHYVEYQHAKKVIRRTRPTIFFYSGLAKGFIRACREADITTCEIQHSPLNRADIVYSYNERIDYGKVNTLPQYLLVNSEAWKEKIYYPAIFKNIGSDYFYNSSTRAAAAGTGQSNIVVVSSPEITNTCIQFTKDLSQKVDIIDPIVLKLHSAEKERLNEIRDVFKDLANVTVIYNEQNIHELLVRAKVVLMGYSSVAYQALQMGVQIFIIKTGYYEGCYDILESPGVTLVSDASEIFVNDTSKAENKAVVFSHFFDKLNKEEFLSFIQNITSHNIN